MKLPDELAHVLAGRQLEPVSLGESGAAVWRCMQTGSAPWYLKASSLPHVFGLEREAACMRWMRAAGLPTPAVLNYSQLDETEFLLTEAAIGVPASDRCWRDSGVEVAIALGNALARLHITDVSACPFDRRIALQLEEARARVEAGQVDEDDFDAVRLGRSAGDVYSELLDTVPAQEGLVFVHGDFCLPNILLTQEGDALHLTGLIDCGRAGIGDRHQDLALAIRSLEYNFDAGTIAPFLDAYGGPTVNRRAIEFFTILDEFF